MMRGLTLGNLHPTPGLQLHLDQCLGCRACERVCPAKLPFARLLEESRAYLNQTSMGIGQKLKLWALNFSLTSPAALRSLLRLQMFRQKYRPGNGPAITDLSLPSQAAKMLWKPSYPAAGTERGSVALFLGCIAKELNPGPIKATIKVLTTLGYRVNIPKEQTCCGGLQLQQGDVTRARNLASGNVAAFGDTTCEAIVSVASGCGATLKAYDAQLATSEGKQFSDKIYDISTFVQSLTWPDDVEFKPCAKKVTVHTPCTLRNALDGPEKVAELLGRLPGIKLSAAVTQTGCCGGRTFTHLSMQI